MDMRRVINLLHRVFLVLLVLLTVSTVAAAASGAVTDAVVYICLAGGLALAFVLTHLSRPRMEDGGIYNLITTIITGIFKTINIILIGVGNFFEFINKELEPFAKPDEEQETKPGKKGK